MFKIKFRNLERSQLASSVVRERFATIMNRFPDFENASVTVTLSMENSPVQAGPDVFTVSVCCNRGLYKGLILEKSASNLYLALADVVEHLSESLSRVKNRKRTKNLKDVREFRRSIQMGKLA